MFKANQIQRKITMRKAINQKKNSYKSTKDTTLQQQPGKHGKAKEKA